MKKVLWLLMLGTLIACGSSTTELIPSDLESDSETAVSTTNETTTETDSFGSSSLPEATNLGDFVPASSVEQAAIIRDQDWGKGATEPVVQIIEYGDFQ